MTYGYSLHCHLQSISIRILLCVTDGTYSFWNLKQDMNSVYMGIYIYVEGMGWHINRIAWFSILLTSCCKLPFEFILCPHFLAHISAPAYTFESHSGRTISFHITREILNTFNTIFVSQHLHDLWPIPFQTPFGFKSIFDSPFHFVSLFLFFIFRFRSAKTSL